MPEMLVWDQVTPGGTKARVFQFVLSRKVNTTTRQFLNSCGLSFNADAGSLIHDRHPTPAYASVVATPTDPSNTAAQLNPCPFQALAPCLEGPWEALQLLSPRPRPVQASSRALLRPSRRTTPSSVLSRKLNSNDPRSLRFSARPPGRRAEVKSLHGPPDRPNRRSSTVSWNAERSDPSPKLDRIAPSTSCPICSWALMTSGGGRESWVQAVRGILPSMVSTPRRKYSKF